MMADSGLAALLTTWATDIVIDASQALKDTIEPPVLSGKLAASGTVESTGPLSATIVYDAETDQGEAYASFTDQGTPAHEIVGNPILSFVWHGRQVFFHRVQHPGTAGTGWFSDKVTDDTWATQLEQAAAARDL